MAKRSKFNSSPILHSLELLGKPIYFLFTFIVIAGGLCLQLITKLLHSIKVPRLHFPTIRALSVILTIAIGLMAYWYIFRGLPSVKLLSDSPPSLTTRIYDRHGTLLYQIYKDENRSLIHLSDLPLHVIQATLAAEDKNFYHHHGVDLLGVLRAATNNFTHGTTQGGSTITQQLVKNVLLTPQKTLTRKLKELVLAVLTERTYSKDQILEMYFNQIPYGGTAYGIEQASLEYFGKSARDLTLAEGTMLAGLPTAPTTLSPYGTNPYLGKIRQQQVLESMVANGYISENEKLSALAVPLVFHPQGISIRAPHFVMYVKDLLVQQYGEGVVSRGGLSVTTSLDLAAQELLQSNITIELTRLARLNVQNGAGLIANPQTGEILAMVGSRDFFDTSHDGQVNVALAPRQPGSAIKPITYTLALSHGLTPSSPLDDSPVCFQLHGQPDYCPKNYDGRFHGRITLRTALASSYNIPAIKLLNTYGLDNMVSLAQQLGITTWQDPSRFGLSLTLGGGEVTLLDLASVYAVFANGGYKVPLSPILTVTDSQGRLIPFSTTLTSTSPVIDPAVAFQINSILSDPAARAPAFGTHSVLNVSANVAVKTGTTNNLRDNWTIGYTPNLLVATWVGNNDNSSMSSVASGITGASPIWAHTMQSLLKVHVSTPFTPPANMVRRQVSCSSPPKYEYVLPGTTPILNCSPTPSGTLLDSAASTSPH